MEIAEKNRLFRQIVWDYNIYPEDIELVLRGEKPLAGHYTCDALFIKLLESYSWFTIVQLFTITEIQVLLTDQVISKLRSPSLRNKYEFVRKRLQEIVQT
jgi:hypothetical protein